MKGSRAAQSDVSALEGGAISAKARKYGSPAGCDLVKKRNQIHCVVCCCRLVLMMIDQISNSYIWKLFWTIVDCFNSFLLLYDLGKCVTL